MYPTEPFVRSVLGPYEPTLCRAIHTAWTKVSGLPERATYDFKRTVATITHQLVMNELRRLFAASRSVHLMEGNETIRLLIERKLVLRIKKMDKRGYTRASPTQATFALTTPNMPLPFASEDLPDVCTADMGYVLNDLETRIDAVLVAARHGDAVLWSYPADDDAGTAVIPTAVISPAPKPSQPATIIKLPVKPAAKKNDDKE